MIRCCFLKKAKVVAIRCLHIGREIVIITQQINSWWLSIDRFCTLDRWIDCRRLEKMIESHLIFENDLPTFGLRRVSVHMTSSFRLAFSLLQENIHRCQKRSLFFFIESLLRTMNGYEMHSSAFPSDDAHENDHHRKVRSATFSSASTLRMSWTCRVPSPDCVAFVSRRLC